MSEPQVIIHNPSAKYQFMKSAKRVGDHRNIMQMGQFQDSVNMALLEYQRMVFRDANDGNSSAAAGMKVKGALEFVDTLFKLGEMPQQPERSKLVQLDHRA
jgi:hypothetical protein